MQSDGYAPRDLVDTSSLLAKADVKIKELLATLAAEVQRAHQAERARDEESARSATLLARIRELEQRPREAKLQDSEPARHVAPAEGVAATKSPREEQWENLDPKTNANIIVEQLSERRAKLSSKLDPRGRSRQCLEDEIRTLRRHLLEELSLRQDMYKKMIEEERRACLRQEEEIKRAREKRALESTPPVEEIHSVRVPLRERWTSHLPEREVGRTQQQQMVMQPLSSCAVESERQTGGLVEEDVNRALPRRSELSHRFTPVLPTSRGASPIWREASVVRHGESPIATRSLFSPLNLSSRGSLLVHIPQALAWPSASGASTPRQMTLQGSLVRLPSSTRDGACTPRRMCSDDGTCKPRLVGPVDGAFTPRILGLGDVYRMARLAGQG